MKNAISYIFLLTIFFRTSWAQSVGSSATQTITLEVKSVVRISVSGNPQPLVINDAIAGSNLKSVSDASTKYSLITNVENMKIVASINDPLPQGASLLIKMENNSAISLGSVDLSNALEPVDVVLGIGKGSNVNQGISYIFSADAEVSEIPSQTRTITLTLTN